MASLNRLVLPLVVLFAMVAFVAAESTVVLDTLAPVTGNAVDFQDPLASEDAVIGSLKTNTFKVLKQFELDVPVETVALNGGAGGISLAGTLGVQLDSEGDVTFAGKNTKLTSGRASFDATNRVRLQANQGDVGFESAVGFEAIGAGASLDADTDSTIYSLTNLEIRANADLDAAASDTLLVNIDSDISVDAHQGSSTFTAGGTMEFKADDEINYNARTSTDIRTSGSFTSTSDASTSIDGYVVNANIYNDMFLTATADVTVRAEDNVNMHGQSVSLASRKVSFTGLNQYSEIAIDVSGDATATAASFLNFRATGTRGGVIVHSEVSETLKGVVTTTVTGSIDLHVGTRDVTDSIKIGSTQTTTLSSQRDLDIIADKTFSASSSNAMNLNADNGRISLDSQKATITAQSTLGLGSPTSLSLTTDLTSGINFNAAQSVSVTSRSTFDIDAFSILTEAAITSFTDDTFSLSSNFGHDIYFLSGTSTTLFASGSITSKASRHEFDAQNKLTSSSPTFSATSTDQSFVATDDVTFLTNSNDINISGEELFSSFAASDGVSVVGKSISLNSNSRDINFSATGALSLTAGKNVEFQSNGGNMYETVEGLNSLTATTSIKVNADNGAFRIGTTNARFLSSTFTASSELGFTGDAETFALSSGDNTNINSGAGSTYISSGQNVTMVAKSASFTWGTDWKSTTQEDTRLSTTAGDLSFLVGNSLTFAGNYHHDFSSGGKMQFSQGDYTVTSAKDTVFDSVLQNSWTATSAVSLTGQKNVGVHAAKDLSVTAKNSDMVITTPNQGNVVTFNSHVLDWTNGPKQPSIITAAGPFAALAPTINLSSKTLTLEAVSGTTVFKAGDEATLQASTSVLMTSVGDTTVASGTNKYIHVKAGGAFSMVSKNAIDITGKGDLTYDAATDLTLDSKTNGRVATQTDLTLVSGGAMTYTAGSSLGNSINFNSNGALFESSGLDFDFIINSGTIIEFNAGVATGIGNALVVAKGGNFGCGVVLDATKSQAFTSGGRTNLTATECIDMKATNAGANFQAAGNAFFESTFDGVVFKSNGADVSAANPSVHISTADVRGNMEFLSREAGIYLISGGNTLFSATGNAVVEGQDGVRFLVTGPAAPMLIKSTAVTGSIEFEGIRGTTIFAGRNSPNFAGNLAVSATNGEVDIRAQDGILFRSYSTISDSGDAVNFVSTNGLVNVNTYNGNNFNASAAGNVRATATSATIQSTAGDVTIDADIKALTATAATGISFGTTEGPIQLDVAGAGSVGAYFTANQAISSTATGNLLMTAQDATKITAATQILMAVSAGCAVVETERAGDDITVDTSFYNANFKDGSLVGNNIDLAAADTQWFPGNIYIGKESTPVIHVKAGVGNLNAGFTLTSSTGDIQLNSLNTMKFTGALDTTLTATRDFNVNSDGTIQITSVGTVANSDFKIINNAGTSNFQAGTQLTVNAPDGISVAAVGNLVMESVSKDLNSYLSIKSALSIDINANNFVSTSDTWNMEAGTGRFTGIGNINIKSSKLTSQDSDQGSISFTSDTTFTATASTNLDFKTTGDNSRLTFQTTGISSDIKIGPAQVLNALTVTAKDLLQIIATNVDLNAVGANAELKSTTGNVLLEISKTTVATSPQDFTIKSTTDDIVLKTGDDIFFTSGTAFSLVAPTQFYRAPTQTYTTGALATITSASTYVTGTTIATTATTITNTLTGNTYFDAATSLTAKSTGGTFTASFTSMNLETTGVSSTVNLVSRDGSHTSSANSDIDLSSTGAMVLQTVGLFTVDTSANVNFASPLGRTDLFASSALTVTAQTGALTFTSNGHDSTNNAGIFVNALNAVTITSGAGSNITVNSQESTSFETQGKSITLTATTGDIELIAAGSQQDLVFRAGTISLSSVAIFSRAASLLDIHAAGAISATTNGGPISLNTLAPFSNIKLAADRFDKDDGQPGLLRWTSTNAFTTSSSGAVYFKTNDAGGELGLGTLRFDSTNGFNFQAGGGNVEFIARSAAIEGKATAVTLTSTGSTGSIQMQAARRLVSTSTGATTITNSQPNLFPIDSYHGDILVRGSRAGANSIAANTNILFRVTEPGDENDLLLSSAGPVNFITGFSTMNFRSLGSKGALELRNNDGPNTVAHQFQGTIIRNNARGGQAYLTQGGNPGGNDIQLLSAAGHNIVMESRGAYETILYESEGNVLMSRPAAQKIQVRNYQSRLGFFSYKPVIIQPIGIHDRETCEYYSVCRVPDFFVDAYVSDPTPVYAALEQRLNFLVNALIDYGLLEYKQRLP